MKTLYYYRPTHVRNQELDRIQKPSTHYPRTEFGVFCSCQEIGTHLDIAPHIRLWFENKKIAFFQIYSKHL